MTRKIIAFLLITAASAQAADIKLSQLPLGAASTSGANDSFPFVNSSTVQTMRMKLSDLINLPTMSLLFDSKASTAYPVFTGNMHMTGNADFSGSVTASSFIGPASGNLTLATPHNHGVLLSGTANATTAITPSSSTAFSLISGGSSADPAWGLLSVPGGGTGLATVTSNGMVYGLGTSALGVTSAGTQYQVFQAGASGVPTVGALNLAQSAAVIGILPNANTTAASANTPSAIVARDGSGNFSAGTVTASVTGHSSLDLAIASNLSDVASSSVAFNNISGLSALGDLIYGGASGTRSRLAGNTTTAEQVLSQTGTGSGSAAPIWLTDTSANTASTLVKRDGSGNFSAGTVTAAVTGTASGNLTYSANNHGVVVSSATNAATVIAPDASASKVLKSGGSSADPSWLAYTDANTVSTLVARDGSGNFSATTVTAALTGTASGNLTLASPSSHGVLLSGAANATSALAPNASTVFPLVSGGSSADPSWASLTAGGGGTGNTSYTKGDILVATGSTTLAKLPVGADGSLLAADAAQTSGVKWSTTAGTGTVTSVAFTAPTGFTVSGSPVTTTGTLALTNLGQSYALNNVGLKAAISTNTLVVNITQADGATDCSSSIPCSFGIRNTTASTGGFTTVSLTAASTITLSATDSIGAASASGQPIYAYFISDGTSEPCLSTVIFDEGTLQSASALTGGADTTAATLWCPSAHTSRPIRILGAIYATWSNPNWGSIAKVTAPPFDNFQGTSVAAQASFGTNCTWTNTSATLASFGVDATCTFTANARNSGKLSLAAETSGGNKLPGVTFTPSRGGQAYNVCAVGSMGHDTSLALADIEMVSSDSSSQRIAAAAIRPYLDGTHSGFFPFALCGQYISIDSSSVSLEIRGSTSAGTLSIGALSTESQALTWSVSEIH